MADRVPAAKLPACPNCKSVSSSRLRREGFLQRHVFPYAGLYPWECGSCRTIFLARGRGKSKKRNLDSDFDPLQTKQPKPAEQTESRS